MTKGIIQYVIALVMSMYSMLVASLAIAQVQASKILAGKLSMKDFLVDPTGDTSPKAIIGIVVALTVGLIVIGYLFPVGMTAYHAINFTAAGMSADEIAMYGVLGVLAILCLMLAMIGVAISVMDK